MAQIRLRPNGRLQYDFHLYGKRFREGTAMMDTPKNRKIAQTQLKKMNAEIDLGTFQYRDYFPDSKKVASFEVLLREKKPNRFHPFFDHFADEWFDRQQPRWSDSYQRTVRLNINNYLTPYFGNTLINEINLAQVDYFRQSLLAMTKEDGTRKLSNRRINNILWPLISVMGLASDEFTFAYPLRRYKALKEEKADSAPLTVEEVKTYLGAVTSQWRDYYIIRFWTGMRGCEINGLYVEHIDFSHRLIKVRQNFVNGKVVDVKTPKSRREIKMCDTVYDALQRAVDNKKAQQPFLFTNDRGHPLSSQYVSKKIWLPTLKKAGLKPRRSYETRHTAAVLHIAAHENPLYISQMLGHSNTRLLFDVYAPYVANASRIDGKAFSDMML